MHSDPTAESRSIAEGRLSAVLRGISRAPGKAMLGLFLLAAGLMALHTAMTREDCSLRLKVQHSFLSAQLYVWLDDGLVYSGRLIGSSKAFRSSKKKAGGEDSAEGSLSETFTVPAGAHEVRVRVVAEDGSAQENSIQGDFTGHSRRTLSVVARGNDVAMNWEREGQGRISTPSPGPEPVQAPEGWLQRYAGSVLVSIIGSIVSAFTGYAIKELPKKITSTQAETPKTRSASSGR